MAEPIDILRDALFGNPPSPAKKPSREGVLAAFTEFEIATQAGIAAAALSGTDLAAAAELVRPLEESVAAGRRQINELALRIPQDVQQAASQATQIATRAAEASLAAATTLPNVFPTIAAGVAGTAVNGTFYAQTRRGIAMYRKTGANASTRLFSLTDSPTLPLSLVTEPDGKIVEFATMDAFSKTLTSDTAIFDASDVGKPIVVARAGSLDSNLYSTIAAVNSATSVTLADAAMASTTTPNGKAGATLGTDCGPGLQSLLSTLLSLGGGEIVIDGLFFLRTPVIGAFSGSASQLKISGSGGDGGLIIATNAEQDAIVLSGGAQIIVDGPSFVGTPLALIDSRRTLTLLSTTAIIRNTGWFGVACIGADDGAVIYAEATSLMTKNNSFGSCVGGLENVTIMNRNFAGYSGELDRFLDYGRFRGIEYIKTGISFTKAWVWGENQFVEDSNAVGQSVFRIKDCRFDEGHVRAVGVTTTIETGKRISRVEIRGMQVNSTLVDNGGPILLERVDYAVIDQPAIGWRNTPGDGLLLNDCGTVRVRGAKITAGAPGTPTGIADGIVAYNVKSLILEDSNFARFTFTGTVNLQRITNGVGAVAPFRKDGRITDADFTVPPPVGTVAIDTANKRLYARFAEGWLGSAVMVTNNDPTYVLRNITPAYGSVTNSIRYTKTSGDGSWNATAGLMAVRSGGFRMRASFASAASGTLQRIGITPASNDENAPTGPNDFRLGVLQNNGTEVYVISDGNILTAPYPYAAGQEVTLEYSTADGTYRMLVAGVEKVSGAVPTDLTSDLPYRFSSSLYSVGAAFDLLEYGPL